MIYKLTSVKTVLAKVYTDLGLGEENIQLTDMIEWAGEALEKIRAFPVYTNKVTGKENIPLLEIENYQARLPMDCFSVVQIAYTSTADGSGGFLPMKYATGSFEGRAALSSDSNAYTVPNPVAPESSLIALVMNLYDLTYAEAVAKLNNEPDIASTITNLYNNSSNIITSDKDTINYQQLEYRIVPGYIKTNVKSGYLMVSYYAIPTDEEGYPMIPDDQSFIEAIYWYINMKIKYIQWSTGKVRDAIYYHAENKWQFYVKQAYGRAMMPASIDEMESVKNVWVRLLPTINAADTFFNYIDQQERLKLYR